MKGYDNDYDSAYEAINSYHSGASAGYRHSASVTPVLSNYSNGKHRRDTGLVKRTSRDNHRRTGNMAVAGKYKRVVTRDWWK
jgi:hypothetical protein